MTTNPGDTIGTQPPAFLEIERRFADLQVLYKQGSIDPQTYQSEVQSLTIQDAGGNTWWYGGEPPGWHLFDGSGWIRRKPSAASKEKSTKVKGPLLWAGLGCAGLLLVGLIVSAIVLIGGYQEYQSMPKIVEGVVPESLATSQQALSTEQLSVRAELGSPEAFSILFYEEELLDGSYGDVRFETWSYYTDGVEYTFINGEMVGEDPIDIDVGELIQIPYAPEQFVAYMNLDEVVASARLDTFLVVPLEKELVDGGEVYYADELTFGLKDDELLYVEALALEVEG
ncbi:MAG: hypothetical protein V3V46_03785 [Anaerolineales bacterium]